MGLGWESFKFLQVVGFAVLVSIFSYVPSLNILKGFIAPSLVNFGHLHFVELQVYGTFLFNGLVRPPLKSCIPQEDIEELLPEEPIEHL